MKDKELKLDEVKAPLTLGGASYILSLYINSAKSRKPPEVELPWQGTYHFPSRAFRDLELKMSLFKTEHNHPVRDIKRCILPHSYLDPLTCRREITQYKTFPSIAPDHRWQSTSLRWACSAHLLSPRPSTRYPPFAVSSMLYSLQQDVQCLCCAQ